MTLRVFSFGGGVQSTAALVLASQGRIDFRTFVFANVGDDTENPDTLAYIEQHSRPFAAAHDLELVDVRRPTRDGETLYARLRRDARSIPIPVRPTDGAPGRRSCTSEFKRKVIAAYLKARGAMPDTPAVIGIGISIDEFHRVRGDSDCPWETVEYPLITLRLSRTDCLNIVRAAGLPQPPKSSCWFCPFKRPAEWRDLKRQHPDLFVAAADLERTLHDRSVALGKPAVWLTRFAKPLDAAVDDGGQMGLFDEDDAYCDSGYCWR